MFDHPDYQVLYSQWDINRLYRTYFSLIGYPARSGLFDIVGRFDLIKVFCYRTTEPVLTVAGAALQAIMEAGLTVEVNTRGGHKPCGGYLSVMNGHMASNSASLRLKMD